MLRAEGGTTAARALVADPQIAAVIGTSCSGAGVPAAQITSEAGVLHGLAVEHGAVADGRRDP